MDGFWPSDGNDMREFSSSMLGQYSEDETDVAMDLGDAMGRLFGRRLPIGLRKALQWRNYAQVQNLALGELGDASEPDTPPRDAAMVEALEDVLMGVQDSEVSSDPAVCSDRMDSSESGHVWNDVATVNK
eukprot:5451872-Amphidinium_carterae.2